MKDNVANRYFNGCSAEYSAAYGEKNGKPRDIRSFIFSQRKRIVLDMFDVKNANVLDIGCGPGVFTEGLLKKGCRVCGVDISERMIEIAKSKNFKNAEFTVRGAGNLQFEDSFFEGVLCVGVLEYLEDAEKALKDIARVTMPGGIAIFTVPNKSSILNMLDIVLRRVIKGIQRLFKTKLFNSIIDCDYEARQFSKGELDSILKRNNFRIEKFKFHIFRISFLNKIFPGLSLLIARTMNFVSSPIFSADYIVKCRKI